MGTNRSREHYLVASLFVRHRENLRGQPFESETVRWLELVVALLLQATDVTEDQIRVAVNILAALDLLDPSTCADLSEETPAFPVMLDVLRDYGFGASEAQKGCQAIIEVARALQRWQGKPQRYLREWGERMLDALPVDMPVTSLTPRETRHAFTWWLQATLGLPVLLPEPAITNYAETHATTAASLVDAADALDLNVALLDEAVALELASSPDAED